MQQNELYHFGVKGMKWGHRKKSYITVRQANKNAKAAMNTARKESIANDKARSKAGERVTYRQASKNAKAAMDTARKESIAKDKQANREARKKANITIDKATKDKIVKIGASAAAGYLTGNLAGNSVLAITRSPVVATGARWATTYYVAKSVAENLSDK